VEEEEVEVEEDVEVEVEEEVGGGGTNATNGKNVVQTEAKACTRCEADCRPLGTLAGLQRCEPHLGSRCKLRDMHSV
jgi:hypothetical protein